MKSLRSLVLLLGLAVVSNYSCMKIDLNTDDLDLGIDLNVIKTFYEIRFTDASTGEMIGELDDVSIRAIVHGPDSLYVLNTSGYRKPEYVSSAGRILLGLDPYNAVPTPKDPVRFTVEVDADGFLPTAKQIITDTLGSFSYEVRLVRLSNLPEGSSLKHLPDAGTADSGILRDPISIQTDGGEVVVTVPEGTLLRDASGNRLNGSISAQLVAFSPLNNESRQAFPEGFGSQIDSAGITSDATQESAGFFNLEISDGSGRRAHLIGNQGICTEVRIDPSIENPNTGQPVQEGDRVSVLSFNQSTGRWQFEKETEVRLSPAGLVAAVDVQHLTWFNFGWPGYGICLSYYYLFTPNPPIYMDVPFHFLVRAFIRTAGGWSYWGEKVFTGLPALYSTFDVNNLAQDQWLRFTSFPRDKYIMLDFVNRDSTCGGLQYAVWMTPSPVTNQVCFSSGSNASRYPVKIPITPNNFRFDSRALINIRIICTDRQAKINPQGLIFCRYRQQGSYCWYYQNILSGYTRVYGLKPATTFEIQAYSDGKWQPESPYLYTVDPNYQHGTEIPITFKVEMKCN